MITTPYGTMEMSRFEQRVAADGPAGQLAGKVVMVTGSVGNLGLAVGHACQEAGAKTVLVDRSLDRLRAAYPGLDGASEHWLAGGVDLTNADSLEKMVRAACDRFGRIDGLVNTVGGYRGGQPVHEMNLADWDFLFDVNVRTTLQCSRAVIPRMLKEGGGRIVNVASRDALAGSAGYAAYSASKSAVLRLTEALAAELKAFNINVNCVMPGTIDTPQNRQAIPEADFSKWVAPEAIAEVILFLLSDASRAVTGAALPVFGKG